MIAYSRAENLRDLLVKAKLPHPEEEDHTYEDFMRYEDTLPPHPSYINFKNWKQRVGVSTNLYSSRIRIPNPPTHKRSLHLKR